MEVHNIYDERLMIFTVYLFSCVNFSSIQLALKIYYRQKFPDLWYMQTKPYGPDAKEQQTLYSPGQVWQTPLQCSFSMEFHYSFIMRNNFVFSFSYYTNRKFLLVIVIV